MNNEIEIAKLALNAGAFGLNVLIIVLIYRLLHRWAPELIGSIRKATKAFGSLSGKIDSLRKPDRKPREKRT